MKFLLSSDLHIKKGIYVDIGLEYLDYIQDYCLSNDIKNIIFLGDIFEKSSKIYNEAFVPVFNKFYEMQKLIFAFILGNHDIYSSNRENSIIEVFSPFGSVYKDFHGIFPNDGNGIDSQSFDFGFLPYTKSEQDLPTQKIKYLFTHLAIADFKFDNNFHVNERIAFPRDLFSNYKLVFSGHFHRHQVRDNIIYVGSPYQLSFEESGVEKGFIVFDSDDGEWEFIKYNAAPEYIKLNIEDITKINEIDFSNKFVKVKITKKVDEFIKLKYILFGKGALEVLPDFESKSEVIKLEKEADDIDMSMSILDIIRECIRNIKNDKIDNKKLMNIFNKIAKEV